jgi:amino acid permease
MSGESSFFGGLDILDGMPSRQAGAILFAIEGRTAQLVSQSRQALASYLTEKTAAEKEQAFLSAIAQGRDLPLQPTIQDIERFAPEWAALVPSDDRQRAALAKKLAEKYHFRRQDVLSLRKALELESDGVRQAYDRLFKKSIDSIYVTNIPLSEKIRWLASRLANSLERMPPFWTAFSLTLTETVGGSVLALPIALAGVGPISGVILLFILGLVNVLTVMGIVEAITRNGNMRYGTAYFGRLVGDYLGKPGSIILIPALLLLNMISLIAFYIGISVSVADITSINPLLWAALLFLIGAYFLRRESLDATVASALVIGIVNITIIIILSLLAFPHAQSENLQYMTSLFGGGQLFEPKILELIFGVVLFAYFGHTSAGNAAKVVLRRDPGGSSLIWGNVAAMMAAIALYSLWVIAVNGAIPVSELSNETGTALSPLAIKIGGSVPILGIIYIILAMGIGTVHTSYALYYQVREALPSNAKKTTQFLVSLAPIFLLFLFVEWMLFTNRESFSQLLGIVGVLLLPLLGGIFPMLMLAASRRKGDYVPKLSLGILGNPFVLTIVYLIYLGSIFAYGLFIWDNPIERFMAIGVGMVLLLVTYLVIRQGALASRAVIELMVDVSDNNERATLTMIDEGKPLSCTLQLVYANAEKSMSGSQVEIPSYKEVKNICVELSSLSSREVKVWIHRVTQEGNSEPISASLNFKSDSGDEIVQLDVKTGQMIRPLSPKTKRLEINLY